MTQPVDTPGAQLVTVGPFEVMAKSPTEEQTLVITKSAAAARRNPAAAFTAVDVVFRVVQALLVDPKDVDLIDTGLIEGTIKVGDLVGILGMDISTNDEPKPKPARTRRSR